MGWSSGYAAVLLMASWICRIASSNNFLRFSIDFKDSKFLNFFDREITIKTSEILNFADKVCEKSQ